MYAPVLTVHVPPPPPRSVDNVYAQVLTIHVLSLVFTIIIFIIHLLFICRPFLAEVSSSGDCPQKTSFYSCTALTCKKNSTSNPQTPNPPKTQNPKPGNPKTRKP